MSFANEEPSIELEWSDYEESAMREELDAVIDNHAYDFVNVLDGDGSRTPAEILLGGVLRPELPNPVDIWVSVLRVNDVATTTIATPRGGYAISDHEIVSVNSPSTPISFEDVKHIRFWINENVASWGKDHSLRIAEEIRRQRKSSGVVAKLIDKFLRPYI